MTIQDAFAAIPNSTCLMRQGRYLRGEQHVKSCERCTAIRLFGLVVLQETLRRPARVRAQIAALGK